MEGNQFQQTQFPVAPEKKKFYKKWWFWLIIVIVVIAIITSQGDSGDPEKETLAGAQSGQEDSSVPEAADTRFKLNETAAFPKLKITATEVKESYGDDFFYPDAGKVFVGVNFTIENISDEDQSVSSLILFDSYVDGIKSGYSTNANIAFSDGTLDGSLSPGRKMQGFYAVEASENWEEIEIEVLRSWLSSNKAVFVFTNE